MGIEQRKLVREQAIIRANNFVFFQRITNVCAGEANPRRHAYFCDVVRKSRKNKYGVEYKEILIKCTDGKGNYWNTDIDVIFSGHLSADESKDLFDPIWQAYYQ